MELPVAPVVFASLVIGGLLMRNAWNRLMGQRHQNDLAEQVAYRKSCLENGYLLRHTRDKYERAKGNGDVAFALFGSYSTGITPDMMEEITKVGAESCVGETLLAELSDKERKQCIEDAPDFFANRVTPVVCAALPGGLQGRTIEEAEEIRHLWIKDLNDAVEVWLDNLDRNGNGRHELLLAIQSAGGHTALKEPALKKYKRRFPDKLAYVITILDQKDVTRRRFPKARRYGKEFERGVIVTDNTRNSERGDVAIQKLIAAAMIGSWAGGQPSQLGNMLAEVFPSDGNIHYATVAAWSESIPVLHIPQYENLPELFYTYKHQLYEKTQRGIKTLATSPQLQSVYLSAAPKGAMRYMYVIIPIVPDPDLSLLAHDVMKAISPWRDEFDRNLQIKFVSCGEAFDATTTKSDITMVLLQPLDDDGSKLDVLSQDGMTIKELPAPEPSQLPATVPVTTKKRGRPQGGKNGKR